MSAFTPTQVTLEPPSRPDNLSAAVLHSLSRPITGKTSPNVVLSFIFGALSFGVVPLIYWPRRFGRFVVAEQQQFWHLVEWLRIRTGDEEAAKLRESVRDTGPIATTWLVPTVLLVLVAIEFVPLFSQPGFSVRHLLDLTYFAGPWIGPHYGHNYYRVVGLGALVLFKIWNVCLLLAYGSHWLHVQQHASDVNRFVRRLNLILAKQLLPPVPLFSVGIGFRPLWFIAGMIGLAHGAFWAIPACFAGAIHQRYVRKTSTRIRGELAQRVNMLLQQQRPAINVPMPHGFRTVCRNERCGKTVPAGAQFCPRCGTRVPDGNAVA
jgi:hypothetical protein